MWKIKGLKVLLAKRWPRKSGETENKGNKKAAHVPLQTWKGWEWDTFSWFPGRPWVKPMLFLLSGATATLIFLPCTTPCSVQLIQQGIKGIQVAARPPDPETAAKGHRMRSLRIIPKPKKAQEEQIKAFLKFVKRRTEKRRRWGD